MRRAKHGHLLMCVVVLCSAALLSGCTVFLDTELPRSIKTRPDPRLIGRWVLEDKDGPVIVEFARARNGLTNLSLETGNPSLDRNPIFSLTTTRINGRNFMIVKVVAGPERIRSFQLSRYEIVGKKLTIWYLNLEKLKTAVQDGKLKGEMGMGMLAGVTVKDRWANIASFLKFPDSDEYFLRARELTRTAH
ncbi:MAG TPA: hypothetical protein VJT71_09690 [Pyrinomonadaceae bacterium]|nr:hypothetical protein [Pyrinomonadaceae bacterium]